MISKKHKRKIIYDDQTYYWYAKVGEGEHRVIVVSEDKHFRAEFPFRDTECAVTPAYVRECLKSLTKNKNDWREKFWTEY